MTTTVSTATPIAITTDGRVPNISPQAEVILKHRYFLKNDSGDTIEDSDALFRRVAKAIANVETL